MTIKGFKGGGGKGGGGGGSTHTPVEDPDNLRSRQFAHLIDLLCEGEIEGPATGDINTSVYYDKTVLQNADGSSNFTGVTLRTRNGTQGQTYLSGFPSAEAETAVQVKVTAVAPVVRTITSSTYSQARITVGVPILSKTNTSNGDVSGSSVEYRIMLQSSGGSYEEAFAGGIRGKSTTRYQRSHIIQLTGDAPWNIKVERVTEDSTSQYVQNDIYWDSYTEIVEGKLRYPNSALVATVIDSQQFNQIPTRGYDMKLLRTQIPANATVRADGSLDYSGEWDGTFQIAWHANPAWVFWDMITSSRYGLGNFVSADQVDKWALFQIGQYCDELVPDGFGGTEPRFSCNLYIQEQREAFTVIQDLASIFRGMVYWSSGLIAAVQDAPADPVALFTNANVESGSFEYSGSSAKTRHSVALVSWNDPDDFYALKPEYVEDADAILRYGVIQTEVIAIGCTSRAQAHRVGKWLLYSETNETETVTFKAGLDGTVVRPGHVINVQDRNRAGTRRGGRLVSATTTALTVDSGFTPGVGVTYTASVMLPSGTVGRVAISGIAGNVLTLAAPLDETPQPDAVWMVSSNDLALQTFRVISVIESDGVFEVTALKHAPDKYPFIERDIILTENPLSTLTDPPGAPEDVSITEALYQSGSTVLNVVTIAWSQVERANTYSLSYQVGDGNTVTIDALRTPIYEIRDALPGTYSVSVVAVSSLNKRGAAGTAVKEILGKTAKPTDVGNFSLAGISNGVAQLVWDQATDLDVIIGGYVRIRHSPETSGATFDSAVDIGPALPGNATTASVPHVDGTYIAKFVDSSGNSSENAVTVITRTASLVNMNVVETIDESGFGGTHDGTFFPDSLGGLGLGYAGDFDAVEDVDSIQSWDTFGGVNLTGEYRFENMPLDLGARYISRVSAAITVIGIDELSNLDERLGLMDEWSSFDGDVVDDVNATIYVRTTDEDPSTLDDDDPEWSSWRPFFVGQYDCRGYDFKLVLTSADPAHNISVTQLVVIVDMPDRTEAARNITSGAGTYSVTFPAAFKAIPAIGITANNMQTGDFPTISNQSPTGFDVIFKNSGGSAVSRIFDYTAKGYGYSV